MSWKLRVQQTLISEFLAQFRGLRNGKNLKGCFFHFLCSPHWGLQEENASPKAKVSRTLRGARFSNPGRQAPPPSLHTGVHTHRHTLTCTHFPASSADVLCEMTPFPSAPAGLEWNPELAPLGPQDLYWEEKGDGAALGFAEKLMASPVWPCSLLV